MTAFNLLPKAVLAVLRCTSKDASRGVLQCLWIREDGVLVATNGVVLGAYRQCDLAESVTVTENFLPRVRGGVLLDATQRTTWTRLAKHALKKDVPLRVTLGEQTAEITYLGASETLTVEVGDRGPFPNIEQVFPRPEALGKAVSAIAFVPDLLSVFGDGKYVHLAFTGAGSVILILTDDPLFVGLLMPWRSAAWSAARAAIETTDASASTDASSGVPAWVFAGATVTAEGCSTG